MRWCAALLALSLATPPLLAQTRESVSPVVEGTVVSDDAEPVPVANAKVVVALSGETRASVLRTDASGRFSFTADARPATVRISRPGFVSQSLDGVRGGATPRVRLVRAGVVSGQLVDDRGEPIGGALIDLRRLEDGSANAAAATVVAETDDLGEFRLWGLASGRYVVATQRLSLAAMVGGAAIPAKSEATVDVVAGRETSVSLSVTMGSTQPAAPRDAAVAVRRVQILPDGRTVTTVEFMPRASGISGRVLDQTGRAVSGATVRLEPVNGTDTMGLSSSDAQGRYAVGVPGDGTFRVIVTAPGSPAVEYGQRRALEKGKTITLRASQRETLDLVVPAPGVITGRITDVFGEPAEGLTVQAWQARWSDGRMLAQPVSNVRTQKTDDRGLYRLSGIIAGTYFLAVVDETAQVGQRPLQLQPLPRLFYPGRATIAAASPLQVESGRDVPGVDMVFDPPRGTNLEGMVYLSTGEAAKGVVQLTADAPAGIPVAQPFATNLDARGRFVFEDVAPGDYTLQVAADREWGFSDEFAFASLPVGGQAAAVALRTHPGTTIAGKVVFEGAAPPPHTTIKITPLPAEGNAPLALAARTPVQLRPNWTFEINDLSGPTRIAATAPDGWWLKSITVGGLNVADEPAIFGEAVRTATDAEAIFVHGTSELSGTVTDGNRPATDYAVLVYPTDAGLQYARSRHMAIVRPDHDGRFRITSLPPGSYWAIAVDSITGDASGGEWQMPDVINQLLPSARAVTLEAGRSVSSELRLVRLGR